MSGLGGERSNGWHGEDWDPDPEEEAGAPFGPPLTWRSLPVGERRVWLERLWSDVCSLQERYRLALRSGWWEDEVQLEALAALAEWVRRYDSGHWDDPPGKLGLLFDLERVTALLRAGSEPFHPERDRPGFLAHLCVRAGEPPPR